MVSRAYASAILTRSANDRALIFVHDVATMNLHGNFAHSKLGRDLLVHQTRRDQTDHLLLTGGQRLEASPQIVNSLVLGAPAAIAFKRHLNGVQEVLVAKRLG